MWGKLSDYCFDVSKYILTAIVISSFFNEFENKWIIYLLGLLGLLAALGILILALFISKKDDYDSSNK